MAKTKKSLKDSGKLKSSPFKDYWGKNNYLIFYLGLGVIILGFILMSIGPWNNPISLSLSPIVLLIGYIIVIPLSILFKNFKKRDKETNVPS